MAGDLNVITALAKVQSEIGGIGKTRPKDGQLSYAYRGIDAIASEAQPLFGKHGVVIVPTKTTITSVEPLTVNGKPWTDTLVSVHWTIYGPGGVDDCIESTTSGLGRDNSDKGVNKAATQAFKNLVLRILCIGDPQDDADQPQHQNNYTDSRPEPQPDPDRIEAEGLFAICKALPAGLKADLKAWAESHDIKITVPWLAGDPKARVLLDAWLHEPMPAEQALEQAVAG